ncbi:hypothetical protein LCGC14_1325070 [marine sediment metagenome]|uniref:Uncharacterized protein n=1 Tax=marine sediment metagenome TaxID=412755 RepID=A0A0F9KIG4_9ZZZZ
MNKTKEAIERTSQFNPNATLEEKLYDFLGRYTILLNGTVCEKEANQPRELNAEHKKEIVDRVLALTASANKLSKVVASEDDIEQAFDDCEYIQFEGRTVLAIHPEDIRDVLREKFIFLKKNEPTPKN